MIKLLFCILLCSMPILFFAQGKITRPNHNGITQSTTSKKETVQGPTIGSVNGHDWVNLGLPSGNLWATNNIGALTIAEEGYYLAWGNTEVHVDTGRDFENVTSAYGKAVGDISGSNKYDAASKKWGAPWRMPTKNDFLELINYCEIKPAEVDNVQGYAVIGRNGQSIFLPYTAVKSGGLIWSFGGCWYWTSSEETSEKAAIFQIFNKGIPELDSCWKYHLIPIRPVIYKRQ